MIIREATLLDMRPLFEVARDYYRFGPFQDHGLKFDEKSMCQFIARLIVGGTSMITLAEADGAIVGAVAAPPGSVVYGYLPVPGG